MQELCSQPAERLYRVPARAAVWLLLLLARCVCTSPCTAGVWHAQKPSRHSCPVLLVLSKVGHVWLWHVAAVQQWGNLQNTRREGCHQLVLTGHAAHGVAGAGQQAVTLQEPQHRQEAKQCIGLRTLTSEALPMSCVIDTQNRLAVSCHH